MGYQRALCHVPLEVTIFGSDIFFGVEYLYIIAQFNNYARMDS
jgi:hypothetical protein